MKPTIKRLIILATIVFGVIGAWLILDPTSPINRYSSISTTREWARVDPFPLSATNLRVETKGSMFTREFIIEFEAPKIDVQNWLCFSPGTSQANPKHQDDDSLRFEITPGGGAQFAEVVVSKDGTRVRIRAFWS